MKPIDPNQLFNLFEVGDEEVYEENGVKDVLQNPYVLMGMVVRGVENYNILDKFLDNLNNGQKVHKRATLYENINLNQIYKLFKDFRCRDDAAQTSFSVYADYLKEWYDRFQNGEEKTAIRGHTPRARSVTRRRK